MEQEVDRRAVEVGRRAEEEEVDRMAVGEEVGTTAEEVGRNAVMEPLVRGQRSGSLCWRPVELRPELAVCQHHLLLQCSGHETQCVPSGR